MVSIPKEHLIVLVIISAVVFLIGDHFFGLMAVAGMANPLAAINQAAGGLWPSFIPGTPQFAILYIDAFALVAALLLVMFVWYFYYHEISKGNFRRGEEHGSSQFATTAQMRAFADEDCRINNTLLSLDVWLRYKRGKDYEHERNRNVVVIGGSGSGKTRGYIKPNLMQIPAIENADEGASRDAVEKMEPFARSFVVTDPKGMTRVETGHMFAEHGYIIKEFNVVDWNACMHYNPIKYIKTQEDVLTFATCLIKNTTPPSQNSTGDPFWENSEKLLYQALLNYMLTELPIEQRNLPMMCKLLDMGEVDNNKSDMSGLDFLFYELETGLRKSDEAAPEGQIDKAQAGKVQAEKSEGFVRVSEGQPDHPAVIAYKSFKSGAAETLQSIFISCKVRLAPLRSAQVEEVLKYDEMDLHKFGDQKMIMYAVPDDQDPTFNFLFALLLWQMLKQLSTRAFLKYSDNGGALPVGVDFLLDEAANFYIPDLEKTVAVCRSRNIGITIVLQSKTQLKARYQDNADTIIDCCDTLVFLGGKSQETNKELEEIMGQQTVTTDNTSQTKGNAPGWSQQIAQHGRALLQSSEIAKMSRSKCLVLINGSDPYIGSKFDITHHPMYKYCDPGHKGAVFKRGFDFAAYKENKKYYEHDTTAEAKLEARLFTASPVNMTADSEEDKKYSIEYRLTIKNTGDYKLYNLHGTIEHNEVCVTNKLAREAGVSVPFPNAEETEISDGIRFNASEKRSDERDIEWTPNGDKQLGDVSYVYDTIKHSDTDNTFTITGLDLEPGETAIYGLVFETNARVANIIILNAYIDHMNDPDTRDMTCDFELSIDPSLTAANCDIEIGGMKHKMSFSPKKLPTITKVPFSRDAEDETSDDIGDSSGSDSEDIDDEE